MRRFIALAVIALHILLVWLLALGSRTHIDRAPQQQQWVTLWIDPPAVPQPPPADPQPARNKPPKPLAAEPPPVASTTVPVVPAVPVEAVPESTAPLITPAPPLDFAGAANRAVQRMVEADAAAAAAAKKDIDLNSPPKGLAKPCVPKKRSMEFKGNGDSPGLHWVGPIPVLVTKRCAFTLGVFSCVLGKLPEANNHLLDDMADPDRPRSSVPDPDKCD